MSRNTKLYCPSCGAQEITHLKEKTQAGRDRYSCRSCSERTCYPLKEAPPPKYEFLTELEVRQRYVVACAQNATPVNRRFFDALLTYCEMWKAQLLIIPIRYHNPTSVWTKKDESQDWWASEVMPYLFTGRADINDNLKIMGDVKITPTSQAPIAGFETISGASSAIFGHPRIELRTVATPQNALPKMLWTTGSVTKENYTESAAGKKGEFHHSFGALTVERVDSKQFFVRHLNADSAGRFFDIAGKKLRRYSRDGVEEWEGCGGLVMGDTHVDYRDKKVAAGTFSKGGLVDILRPKHLVWHDLIDSYSISHHHLKDPFIQLGKIGDPLCRVALEVQRAFDYAREMTPKYAKSIFVPSNHLDHITKWIKETDWKRDLPNAEFYLETALHLVRNTQMGEKGVEYPDPVVWWGKRYLTNAAKFLFPSRRDDFFIKTISVGNHGDQGVDGGKGSLASFSRIGIKTVTGHTHRPGIIGGAWSVGTNGILDPEFVGNLSSWFHTDIVIYDNSKRQMINFINGRFCL